MSTRVSWRQPCITGCRQHLLTHPSMAYQHTHSVHLCVLHWRGDSEDRLPCSHAHIQPCLQGCEMTHLPTHAGLAGNLVSHTASQSATITAARGSLSKDLVKCLKVYCTVPHPSSNPPSHHASSSSHSAPRSHSSSVPDTGTPPLLAGVSLAGAAEAGAGTAHGAHAAMAIPGMHSSHAPSSR
jgi:hypothetical protein